MRVAVYLRVSTDAQDLASQTHAIDQWLTTRPDSVVTRYQDKLSGKRDDRPGLAALCQAVDRGEVDTVLVYRLDRVSRKSVTAMRLLLDWLNKGVGFIAVDQPYLALGKDNPLRVAIAAIFADLAQLEREAIVSRVRAGIKAAQSRGVRIGALPKLTAEQQQTARQLLAAGLPTRAVARQLGVNQSTISRLGRSYATRLPD